MNQKIHKKKKTSFQNSMKTGTMMTHLKWTLQEQFISDQLVANHKNWQKKQTKKEHENNGRNSSSIYPQMLRKNLQPRSFTMITGT